MILEEGRFFFGAQVEAPWPKSYPPGRLIEENMRHLTLAFLGDISLSKLEKHFPSIPLPPFQIGPSGIAKKLIFLPPKKSRVVALDIQWLDTNSSFNIYQKELVEWLKLNDFWCDERMFLPHVTIARAPFNQQQWQEDFIALPLFASSICLYQSIGNLHYQSVWDIPLLSPFEEFEHTADMAFLVRGSTLEELHQNAQLALAFQFPLLIPFFQLELQNSLDEIIMSLNAMISKADAEIGCPFKAVSFHGKMQSDANHLLNWEMIVDV